MKHGMFVVLAALVFATALQAAETPSPVSKPNIVVILVDDLGYGDVSCYGATKVKTPNIDRLAREGRRFTDAHSASAVCTPSRYALLTGQYGWRVDSWGPIGHGNRLIVDTQRLTVPRLLKNAGYATACFGKWHLGFGEKAPDWNGELKPGPLEVGFDYYFGMPTVSCSPPYVFVENHRVFGLDPADPLKWGPKASGPAYAKPFSEKFGIQTFRGGRAAHELYKDEEICSNLTERAVRWIEQQKDKPFFLYFAATNIHHPFTPHPRFLGSSGCGLYGDFIQELDWAVGEILQKLDNLKLADNTLVIFTSDNGGMLNAGGQAAWKAGHRLNGDLLGFKFDAWEGGHRVPFIARWPGKIEKGSTSSQLICHIDCLASFAAITGQALGPDDGPDSFNVLPAWTGTPERPVRDHVVLAPHKKANIALRKDRWLYIGAQGGGGFIGKPGEHTLGGPAALQFAGEVNSDVENGRIKPDAPAEQLYDLDADPRQSRNVVRENPEVTSRLKALLNDCQTKPRTAPRQ
jgi:arylsulfatase A-like enzyme